MDQIPGFSLHFEPWGKQKKPLNPEKGDNIVD
jgi:hypothetical protein